MTDSRSICKPLVLPLLLGIDHAGHMDLKFLFSFYRITELGNVTSHSSFLEFSVGGAWGRSSQNPGLPPLPLHSSACTLPPWERGAEPSAAARLFPLLLFHFSIYIESSVPV